MGHGSEGGARPPPLVRVRILGPGRQRYFSAFWPWPGFLCPGPGFPVVGTQVFGGRDRFVGGRARVSGACDSSFGWPRRCFCWPGSGLGGRAPVFGDRDRGLGVGPLLMRHPVRGGVVRCKEMLSDVRENKK